MNTNKAEILAEAVHVLMGIYPAADRGALERNLYFPLKRCLQFRSELCSGFPECMCGNEVIEKTFLGQPVPPPLHSGKLSVIQGDGPKPPPDSDDSPEAPAIAMAHPAPALFTDAVAKKKVGSKD